MKTGVPASVKVYKTWKHYYILWILKNIMDIRKFKGDILGKNWEYKYWYYERIK